MKNKEKVFLMAFALLGVLFLSGCVEEQTEEPVEAEEELNETVETEMFEQHCVTMEDDVWCSVELNREDCLNAGNRWLGLTEECMKKRE